MFNYACRYKSLPVVNVLLEKSNPNVNSKTNVCKKFFDFDFCLFLFIISFLFFIYFLFIIFLFRLVGGLF